MTVRRLVLLLGAVALIAGIIGLLVPVSVSADNGESIGCGNALAANYSAADSKDQSNLANLPIVNQVLPGTHYGDQCRSAVEGRRWWSIPLTIVGAVAVVGSFFLPDRAGNRGGLRAGR